VCGGRGFALNNLSAPAFDFLLGLLDCLFESST
jgi:hypothetical protein